ncbi:hypothetical protein RN95_10105 [Fusobacterium nucleatum subsp. nucleatum]|nr:hypothetical protein RN95_10105 [Fusobacterium nucleatum subsp. nucleatum]
MADFNSHIITNAGRNLLARALAGEGKVLFTKAAFGDQKHSGNLREVTELKNKKLDLNVMNIRNDNGTAVLTVQISNENVEQSFQTEEFGVYAKIEGDITEILYSYTTAVSADTFPNNRLGKTYESIQDIYMAISSDIEAEIYVRDGVIYLTRDIANQVYTETGLIAVGTLKGRNNLEADKQYLADNGHWYKNIGGNRTWEATSGTPDEQLIPITWKYLYESLNNKENQLIQNLNGILGQNNGEFPVEQAVAGNVYYFPRNQKYYYCLKSQTSRVSVPNADFEELSIYQNRKKLENLFSLNLIKTSQKKGYKFYVKPSHAGNYIDVSDTFSSVDFCVISPYRVELTDSEAKLINYQGFDGRNILINAMWINGSSIEKKYNSVATNNINTASCIAFVYGTLK